MNGTFASTSGGQDAGESLVTSDIADLMVGGPTPGSATGPRSSGPEPDRDFDRLSDGDREDSAAERGLRGLVGGGSSQVTATAAMRARDAARPAPADLAAAEAELVIIRRGWVPREELPRPGRQR